MKQGEWLKGAIESTEAKEWRIKFDAAMSYDEKVTVARQAFRAARWFIHRNDNNMSAELYQLGFEDKSTWEIDAELPCLYCGI